MAAWKRKPQRSRMSLPKKTNFPAGTATELSLRMLPLSWTPTSPWALLALSIVVVAATVGCRGHGPENTEQGLRGPSPSPDGLQSLVLSEPQVLNRRDCAYALAFTPKSDGVAFTHHVLENMELSFWRLSEPTTPAFLSTSAINHHEYDVEDLVAVPDRTEMAMLTVSRQGQVRLQRADAVQPDAVFIDGRSLLRVAINPSASLAAVATDTGDVVLLKLPEMSFRGTAKLHEGAIRGLAFLADDELLSAGDDQQMLFSRLENGVPNDFRIPARLLPNGSPVALAHVRGRHAIATTFLPAQPKTFITNGALSRLGINVTADTPRQMVRRPNAMLNMPEVHLNELQFRYGNLGNVVAYVCDSCVPPSAELVLGADAMQGRMPAMDIANESVSLGNFGIASQQQEPGTPLEAIANPLHVRVTKHLRLPGHATDLSVALGAEKAVVSFSHARAQRSPEIYEAEKAGIYPPPSPVSGALVINLRDFSADKRLIGHRGFTVTAAISPDARFVATGGWDERVLVFDVESGQLVHDEKQGWLVRKVRFSPDGRYLGVAAWTHPATFGLGGAAPSVLLYPVRATDAPTTN